MAEVSASHLGRTPNLRELEMNTSLVPCRRTRNGQRVTAKIAATWLPTLYDWPLLTIANRTGNVVNGRLVINHYRVQEFSVRAGRGFLLFRQADQVEREARAEGVVTERYSVEVAKNGNHRCDCRGFDRFGYCKHVDVMAHLVAHGVTDPVRGEPETVEIPAAEPVPQGDDRYQEEVREWKKQLDEVERDAE